MPVRASAGWALIALANSRTSCSLRQPQRPPTTPYSIITFKRRPRAAKNRPRSATLSGWSTMQWKSNSGSPSRSAINAMFGAHQLVGHQHPTNTPGIRGAGLHGVGQGDTPGALLDLPLEQRRHHAGLAVGRQLRAAVADECLHPADV